MDANIAFFKTKCSNYNINEAAANCISVQMTTKTQNAHSDQVDKGASSEGNRSVIIWCTES